MGRFTSIRPHYLLPSAYWHGDTSETRYPTSLAKESRADLLLIGVSLLLIRSGLLICIYIFLALQVYNLGPYLSSPLLHPIYRLKGQMLLGAPPQFWQYRKSDVNPSRPPPPFALKIIATIPYTMVYRAVSAEWLARKFDPYISYWRLVGFRNGDFLCVE